MMKKHVFLLLTSLLLLAVGSALASGVTVTTWTPFADLDFAAQAYMDAITEWEGETENVADDVSGLQSDEWLAALQEAAASGKADIVIVPLGSGLSTADFLTAEELLAADPDCGGRVMPAFAEEDGTLLLTPVRFGWEGLYINNDVLEANGLSVPETFEQLIEVSLALSAKGITPISNALGDWAEVAVECAALSGAPGAEFGSAESMSGASAVLSALTAVGAFGKDVWEIDDTTAETRFTGGEAAMRIDADWLTELISEDRMAKTSVVLLPAQSGSVSEVTPGMPVYGLAVSRAAMQDENRREAVLSLTRTLLANNQLMCSASDTLGQSVRTLTESVTDCAGTLFQALDEDLDAQLETVVSMLKNL